MSRRARCASCRRSIGTSRASRSRVGATGSSSQRASSPARASALRRAGFWFARSARTGRRSSGAFPRSNSPGCAPKCLCSPKRRSPGKARPDEFEAVEKPRFVGVEADETPTDRDVVQLAEDFLQRLQLRNHLLVRKSRREELAAIAQALHANAHGMTLGRISPVRTARLLHQLAVRALQRRGAELGEALRCGLGLERD